METSNSSVVAGKGRVTVRMYRQGLGDCFLISLSRKDGPLYRVLIDCGVILGTAGAAAQMQAVVQDIVTTTGGHLDLLVATHEHWDHLSGFVQAQELFKKLTVDRVWVGWTEHPADPLALELRSKHQAMRIALGAACARLRAAGGDHSDASALLGFFGAAGQGSVDDALNVVKGLCPKDRLRFCYPSDEPEEMPDIGARFYVLGPPHDKQKIMQFNPSEVHPETYGLADFYMDRLAPEPPDASDGAPFDPNVQIPFETASSLPFFQRRYWGEDPDATPPSGALPHRDDPERGQSWRRIDTDWLDTSAGLALQLDSATNNTSLVIAIELTDTQEVLLFVADAQVGNWLSWQELSWKVGGKKVTGPDLLSRTVFYKTGHHGSHNATLREKGLELMKHLRIAMIPVDEAMAIQKGWGRIPLGDVEKKLSDLTHGRVLRIDKAVPPGLAGQVTQDPAGKLYYEIAI